MPPWTDLLALMLKGVYALMVECTYPYDQGHVQPHVGCTRPQAQGHGGTYVYNLVKDSYILKEGCVWSQRQYNNTCHIVNETFIYL